MPETCVIHWFRRDLRLADNTALSAALGSGDPVLPVYLAEREPEPDVRTALADLDRGIRERGGRLLVAAAEDVPRELNRLAHDAGAWALYFNRDYAPEARERDNRVTRGMQLTGIVTMAFDDLCLVPPYRMLDPEGGMPESFEDFWPRWLDALDPASPAEPEAGAGFVPAAEVPGAAPAWMGDAAAGSSAEPALEDALRLGTVSPREAARLSLAAGAAGEAAAAEAERLIEALARRDFALHRDFAAPSRGADSGRMP